MVNQQFYKDTYSKSDVETLCEIGKLLPSDADAFRSDLEHVAAIYRWQKGIPEVRQTRSSIAGDLKKLLKRIDRLQSSLDGLPDEAAHYLRRAMDADNEADFVMGCNESSLQEKPSFIFDVSLDPDAPQELYLELSDFRKFLAALERSTSNAIEALPKRKSGQARDHALRQWISNISDIWRRTTPAPFKRDQTDDGEPVSPAARFCVAAFQVIDPARPSSLILLEMRRHIRKHIKPTGKVRVQK